MGRRPKNARRDSFGAWLHYLRKSSGLSQEEVSQRLGELLGGDPASGTVSAWERKGNLAGRENIPALANILGVSLETLLRVKRNKSGQYEPVKFTVEEVESLQNLGRRREWDWEPDPAMPQGYDAQRTPYKAKNVARDTPEPPEQPTA